MKKHLLYLSGIVLLTLACNRPEESQRIGFSSSDMDSEEMTISPELISVQSRKDITMKELPTSISKNLREDDFFSSLDLIHATRIQEKSRIYYDLTFEDEEDQTIMAAFDENGDFVPL